MHRAALESSALPPNQYNEDSLPQAAILVFLFSWRDLGLAGQNAQKQVFSHGGTTENLKKSLSDPPNGCLISKTSLADPLIGCLISKTTLADPLIGCLISKTTLTDPLIGHLISKTTLADPLIGRLISKTTLADPLIGHLISKTTLADPLIGHLISKITLPKRQNTSYIQATRSPISKNIWLSSKWDTRECYLLIIVKFGLSP